MQSLCTYYHILLQKLLFLNGICCNMVVHLEKMAFSSISVRVIPQKKTAACQSLSTADHTGSCCLKKRKFRICDFDYNPDKRNWLQFYKINKTITFQSNINSSQFFFVISCSSLRFNMHLFTMATSLWPLSWQWANNASVIYFVQQQVSVVACYMQIWKHGCWWFSLCIISVNHSKQIIGKAPSKSSLLELPTLIFTSYMTSW